MHVAIMATHFGIGQPSSSEPHLGNIVNAISKIDQNNKYIIFVRSDNKECFPIAKNIEYIICTSICKYRWLRIFYDQLVVPIILLWRDIDVLHFTANAGPIMMPCKSVGTIHWVDDPILSQACRWDRRIYLSLTHGRSMRKADRLMAVSKACKDECVRVMKIPEEKIEVIYHGVGKDFKPDWPQESISAMRSRYGLREKYLLSVTNSSPYKNLSTLIDAYVRAKLDHQIPHQMVMVGDIDQNYLNNLIKKFSYQVKNIDWTQEVVSIGYVPYREIPVLYGGASLLIYVSLRETFGIPLVEAMASGIPMIVSNIPALKEIAGDAAIIVDPNNSKDVSLAIHKIISNPTLGKILAARGQRRVTKFSWEQAARDTIKVYQQVLALE